MGTDGPGLELKSIIPFIPFLEKVDFFHQPIRSGLDGSVMLWIGPKINRSVIRKEDFTGGGTWSGKFPCMVTRCQADGIGP